MNIADAKEEIKKEFSSDEKVLESAFKLETLYKKYKVLLWTVVIVLLLAFAGKTTMDAIKTASLAEANKAFLTLQANPDDAAALATLKKKNPALYELFTFSQAAKNKDSKSLAELSGSSDPIISDMSAYTAAVLDNKSIDSQLYREMALLEQAYLAIKAGDTKNAKLKLELIDERSPLYTLASLLKHSVLKVK